jgi:hypothetical protein
MEDKEKYQEHLDWHFRLNKKDKDEMKIAKFRKWYFDSQDWIDFEEIQDVEERGKLDSLLSWWPTSIGCPHSGGRLLWPPQLNSVVVILISQEFHLC